MSFWVCAYEGPKRMLGHLYLELQMLVNHTVLALDESSEHSILWALSTAPSQVKKVSYLDIHLDCFSPLGRFLIILGREVN